MMDFVVPRHSTVMDRLRRRIELLRRHHSSCESRYNSTATERLEVERQKTLALHQRCLQTKAKRASKHRQPLPGSDQVALRGAGSGGRNANLPDGGTGENRNSTLIALHETVKKKLETAVSLLNGDQSNTVRKGFSLSQKPCVDDNGSVKGGSGTLPPHLPPLDNKQMHNPDSPAPCQDLSLAPDESGTEEHWESGVTRTLDLKQEPIESVLPSSGCMMNNLLPDLSLNEQEWKELMEELGDMQDIFSDGFEDRKDPQVPLPTDPLNIKSDIHPTWVTPYQETSDSLPQLLPQEHLLPLPSTTDLSRALLQHQAAQDQQNTQLTAQEQQNVQLTAQEQQNMQLTAQIQQNAQLAQMQYHEQSGKGRPHTHQPCWPQATVSPDTLARAYSLVQPTNASSSLQDFPKTQMPTSAQSNSSSPKSSTSGTVHSNTCSSLSICGPPGIPDSSLDYSNTKPLCHYEEVSGAHTPKPKHREALLYLLQQPRKPGEKQPFHSHLAHSQEKQQVQRHLTHQTGPYQSQQNPQDPLQLPVNQFPGSCQGMAPFGRTEVLATGGQRMFFQTQSLTVLGQTIAHASNPPVSSNAVMILQSCSGRMFNGMGPGLHTVLSSQPHSVSPAPQQRPPLGPAPQQRPPLGPAPLQRPPLGPAPQQRPPLGPAPLQRPPLGPAPLQRPPIGPALLQRPPLGPAPLQRPPIGPALRQQLLDNSLRQNQLVEPQHQPQLWRQGMPVLSGDGGPAVLSSNSPAFHMQAHKLPKNAPCSQVVVNSSQHMATMNSAKTMSLNPHPRAKQLSQDFSHFSHSQNNQVDNCSILHYNRGYQVTRTANQNISFEYSAQSRDRLPSFPEDSDLMNSLLKNQTMQEWIDDLDDLLSSHQ